MQNIPKPIQNKNKNYWKIMLGVLLMGVYLLPIFLSVFTYLKIGTTTYIVFGTALLSLVLLTSPFVLFKLKTASYIAIALILLSPLEIIHLLLYKESVAFNFIMLIFQTDKIEIWELISFQKFAIIVFLLIIALSIFFSKKCLHNHYLITKKFRRYFLVLLLVATGALYIFSIKSTYNKTNNFNENYENANRAFGQKFRKIYPANIFMATYKAHKFHQELNNINPELRNFKFNAIKNDKLPEREIYVLVIGETARFHNFSINGYHRETTPLLAQTQNLISYTDVYSQANYTQLSLRFILSRATPHNQDIYSKEKTLVDAFAEAGFATYWIANQSIGNPYVISTAKRCDASFFTVKEFDSEDNYDENLWQYMDEVLAKKQAKQFIVLHTLGSHFRYNLRYPEAFKKFTPDLEGRVDYNMLSKKMKEQLVNSYDNSILYTDYFLAKTIEKLDKTDAVTYLCYLSDHGENLYDDEHDLVFHAGNHLSKYEVHIPFLLWTSPKYQQYYQDKQETITANKDKKLATDIVFYSLLDMANIMLPEDNFIKSIANPDLEEDSIRYVLNPKYEIIAVQ